MTDKRISELTELDGASVANDDALVIVDTSDTTSKKISFAQFKEALGGVRANRNLVINGNFAINQRLVSGTVTLSAGEYGHDRFMAGAAGCTYTFATSENVTTLTITAGSLVQVVEGLNLQSGIHTLSWVGTAQGKIGSGSYSDTGVTGSVTGGSNLPLEFGTGTLSLVQLEAGDTATPFEHRLYADELVRCHPYFRTFSDDDEHLFMFDTTGDGAGGALYASRLHTVVMRVPPSAGYISINAVSIDTSFFTTVLTEYGVRWSFTATASDPNAYVRFVPYYDAEVQL